MGNTMVSQVGTTLPPLQVVESGCERGATPASPPSRSFGDQFMAAVKSGISLKNHPMLRSILKGTAYGLGTVGIGAVLAGQPALAVTLGTSIGTALSATVPQPPDPDLAVNKGVMAAVGGLCGFLLTLLTAAAFEGGGPVWAALMGAGTAGAAMGFTFRTVQDA